MYGTHIKNTQLPEVLSHDASLVADTACKEKAVYMRLVRCHVKVSCQKEQIRAGCNAAARSELRQGEVKGFRQELGIVCGDAHRGLDAEDIAMQSSLADQDPQLSQSLHDLQAGRMDT